MSLSEEGGTIEALKARLVEGLSKIPAVLNDRTLWESDRRAVFSLLRKSLQGLTASGLLEGVLLSNTAIEDTLLFLIAMGKHHPNRRTQLETCFRTIGASYNWSMAFRGSRKVRSALQLLTAEMREKVLEISDCKEILVLLKELPESEQWAPAAFSTTPAPRKRSVLPQQPVQPLQELEEQLLETSFATEADGPSPDVSMEGHAEEACAADEPVQDSNQKDLKKLFCQEAPELKVSKPDSLSDRDASNFEEPGRLKSEELIQAAKENNEPTHHAAYELKLAMHPSSPSKHSSILIDTSAAITAAVVMPPLSPITSPSKVQSGSPQLPFLKSPIGKPTGRPVSTPTSWLSRRTGGSATPSGNTPSNLTPASKEGMLGPRRPGSKELTKDGLRELFQIHQANARVRTPSAGTPTVRHGFSGFSSSTAPSPAARGAGSSTPQVFGRSQLLDRLKRKFSMGRASPDLLQAS
jgi:hypothetical protein